MKLTYELFEFHKEIETIFSRDYNTLMMLFCFTKVQPALNRWQTLSAMLFWFMYSVLQM